MPTHVRSWTQRRFNRKKAAGEPLKILHCEISEDSFNYLAALTVASKMCKGEIIDALISRYMNEKKEESETVAAAEMAQLVVSHWRHLE